MQHRFEMGYPSDFVPDFEQIYERANQLTQY